MSLESKKDRVGQEVKISDTVAYCTVGYSDLSIGKVNKITPHGFTIAKDKSDTWINRRSYQVIKVEIK